MTVATISLSGDRSEMLEAIASADFSRTAAIVWREPADLGRAIVAFQPFWEFEGMSADRCERLADHKLDVQWRFGRPVVCSDAAADNAGNARVNPRTLLAGGAISSVNTSIRPAATHASHKDEPAIL